MPEVKIHMSNLVKKKKINQVRGEKDKKKISTAFHAIGAKCTSKFSALHLKLSKKKKCFVQSKLMPKCSRAFASRLLFLERKFFCFPCILHTYTPVNEINDMTKKN